MREFRTQTGCIWMLEGAAEASACISWHFMPVKENCTIKSGPILLPWVGVGVQCSQVSDSPHPQRPQGLEIQSISHTTCLSPVPPET